MVKSPLESFAERAVSLAEAAGEGARSFSLIRDAARNMGGFLPATAPLLAGLRSFRPEEIIWEARVGTVAQWGRYPSEAMRALAAVLTSRAADEAARLEQKVLSVNSALRGGR